MLHAPTFADVERRLNLIGSEQPQPLGERLVSILFALPTAFVMNDLGQNRAYYDLATGDAWDLFVAGYYAYGSEGDPDEFDLRTATETPWAFSPHRFLRFRREVERASEGSWRFSGEADLVSFMCYRSQPDWETLRAVNLRTGQTSLGEVVEGLRLWQTTRSTSASLRGPPISWTSGRLRSWSPPWRGAPPPLRPKSSATKPPR